MKQKIMIKLSMKDPKAKTKAMEIAFSFSGVEKADFGASGKDGIEVVGNDVDSVDLVVLLRKKFRSAELLSVSVVKEEKPKPQPPKVEPPPPPPPPYVGYLDPTYRNFREYQDQFYRNYIW